jgi:hypothetical protein
VTAALGPDARTLRKLVEALVALTGCPVDISIADAPTGIAFVTLSGVLDHVEPDLDGLCVEVVLADGAGAVRLFADMVAAITADEDGVRLSYRAGDVAITRCGDPKRPPADKTGATR